MIGNELDNVLIDCDLLPPLLEGWKKVMIVKHSLYQQQAYSPLYHGAALVVWAGEAAYAHVECPIEESINLGGAPSIEFMADVVALVRGDAVLVTKSRHGSLSESQTTLLRNLAK